MRFRKRKQKTLNPGLSLSGKTAANVQKFFGSFFQKRTVLLSYLSTGVSNMRNRKAIALCFLAALPAACQVTAKGLNAAQVAVLKQQGFVEKSNEWELALSSKVLFDVDDDKLKPETRVSITHTGEALHSVQITRVRVEGYTDNTGTDAHNDALSQRRAASVAAALGSSGFSGGHIDVHGFGKANPVADNSTEAGRAENRRVAIIVPDVQD
jgi:outer membrane protein OmpA-like peptidoglycan-associated protein